MIQKIQYNTYIIDLDRVNQLTSHPNDNPSNNTFSSGFVYTHTRKLLKEYLEIYSQYSITNTESSREKWLKVCEILHYNKILVSQADIRDSRLSTLLGSNKLNSVISSSRGSLSTELTNDVDGIDYDEDGFDDRYNPNSQ